MINSKRKGKRGESESAKLLEKWWGGHFCRTPDSGAFMTFHTKTILDSGNNVSGDLICPEDFPFCVEVKRRKEIDLYKCIRSSSTDSDYLFTWIEQTKRDSERGNKIPLLMFKEDRRQWYICLPTIFIKELKKDERNYLSYLEFSIISSDDLFSKTKEEIISLCNTYQTIIKTT
jgi:hypothetical protein